MKKFSVLMALTAVVMAGCSSTEETAQAGESNKEDLVCEYYKPTGSHLKQKVCMTKAQKEQQRIATERDKRNLSTQQNVN